MSRKVTIAGLSVTVIGLFLFLGAYARSSQMFALSGSSGPPLESQGISDRVEAELLVLRSDGFKPSEITRPTGRFLLSIQNQSSEEELSLVLRQERGGAVREVHTLKRQSKFKELLNLTPGRYMLVETNHPDWNCTITITPQ